LRVKIRVPASKALYGYFISPVAPLAIEQSVIKNVAKPVHLGPAVD